MELMQQVINLKYDKMKDLNYKYLI